MPLGVGRPAEGYPLPWSVFGWLEGERATPAEISDARQAAVELAEFLAALQKIDATGGPPPEWSNGFRGGPVDDDRDSPIVESRVRAKIAALEGLADTTR